MKRQKLKDVPVFKCFLHENFWISEINGKEVWMEKVTCKFWKPLLKRGIHQTGNLKSVLMNDYCNACMDDDLEKEGKIQAND